MTFKFESPLETDTFFATMVAALFVCMINNLKMPLFGSKFSPKKTPLRKNRTTNGSTEDLFGENHSLSLKLGQQECIFENGEWVPESGSHGTLHKQSQKLRNRIQELQEENNMLKLKYQMMLNMLTQATAESHVQEKQIQKLQRVDGKMRQIK